MTEREKARIKMANWRKNNPEKSKKAQRRDDFKSSFGVTIEQYEQLLNKQNGRCCCCGNIETALSNRNTIRRLSIDHCHSTGKIRGLLCYRCNYILGLAKDNSTLLKFLALYVDGADTGLKVPIKRLDPKGLFDGLEDL